MHPPDNRAALAVAPPSATALAARAMLAHRCPAFHLRTCGLRGGAAAIAALIGCWDQGRGFGSWDAIDYFLYIDTQLPPLHCASSGNDP